VVAVSLKKKISVLHAIRDAIAATADDALSPKLDAPATAEAILASIEELAARRASVTAAPAAAEPVA